MKLKDYFAVTQGAAKYALSENDKPLCSMDFWHKYGGTTQWEKDVKSVNLIPRRKDATGLWYDDVVCIISLA